MGTNGSRGSAVGRGCRVRPEVSFEFFPPRTERGRTSLVRTATRFAEFAPAFYSVTYGAGGSTRDRTFAAVSTLRANGMDAVPHISWGDSSEKNVLATVDAYRRIGVARMVVLRGDAPSGAGTGAGTQYADALVRLLRARLEEPLTLYVAAYPEVHPEARSASADVDFLKRKVDAGANGCITQYFYHAEAYFHFRERCAARGINVPIVPGVMPISDRGNLLRFSDKAGADVPRWIRKRLDELDGNDDALQAFGTQVVTTLCERLLAEGVPGLHFYTLNKVPPTAAIARNLNLAVPRLAARADDGR